MNGSGVDELVRRLTEGLPESLGAVRRDLKQNFHAILQASLGRLDLATREEFDVQGRLLERARARVEELEARLAGLEGRLAELEAAAGTKAAR